jgi:hypothetical protein
LEAVLTWNFLAACGTACPCHAKDAQMRNLTTNWRLRTNWR